MRYAIKYHFTMATCTCIEMSAVCSESIYFRKLYPDTKEPKRKTSDSVGYELCALEDSVLPPGKVTKIRTGIALDICPLHFEFYAQLCNKSSIFMSKGLILLQGVIDPGYSGEIFCAFRNITDKEERFSKHQEIAQIVFVRNSIPKLIERKGTNIDNIERGTRGFGKVTPTYIS